jgi:hypothetical protein
MKVTTFHCRWSPGMWLAAALLVTAGCQRDEDVSPLGNDTPVPALSVGLELSSATAPAGQRVALAITAKANLDEKLHGLQGYVRFNPAALSYEGQAAGLKGLVLVNDRKAASGELRIISVESHGLDARTATLVFQVKDPSYSRGISYQFEAAASPHHEIYKAAVSHGAVVTNAVAVPEAERLTAAAWVRRVAPDLAVAPQLVAAETWKPGTVVPSFMAGQYQANLVYGNADLAGGINVNDVAYLSDISVGASVLFDATNKDAVIAGNVRPINGGTGGTPRPGVIASGGVETGPGVIDVNDVSAVSDKSVGLTVSVVGDVIPGRGPTNPDGTGKPRVVITADISTNTTWTSGNVYQLGDAAHATTTNGNVYRVSNGATLTIQPGTRIEGWPGSGTFGAGGVGSGEGTMYVARDGKLIADGTALQPIVFTCVAPPFAGPNGEPAGQRWSGCWGGLFINGNATINSDSPTSGSSPAITGRSAGGCIDEADESDANQRFGGCNDTDDSGILRYVRSEYGGARFTANKERNGVTFNAVGSGTVVDYVQAYSSLDDGFEFFGGTVNVKHLYAVGNEDDNFDWVLGWRGKAQFLLEQSDSTYGDRCIEADNNGIDAGDPERTPRSDPIIFNVTCVGKAVPVRAPAAGTPNCKIQNGALNCVTQAFELRQSTAGTIRNAIAYRFAVGLDLDQPNGTAGGGLTLSPQGLCTQLQAGSAGTIGTGLSLRNALISVGPAPASGNPSVAADPDGTDPGVASGTPQDCGPYTVAGGFTGSNLEAMYIADAANAITTFAAGNAAGDFLVDPLNVLNPDFRPKAGSAPTTVARATPPSDGFFDAAAYIGAVAPVNGSSSNIPWYVGWTRGWVTSTLK